LRQRSGMNKERQFPFEDRHHRFPAQIGFEIGGRILPRLPIGTRNLKRVANLLLRLVDFLLLVLDRLPRARSAVAAARAIETGVVVL
jgi:hypothetical protein